MTPAPTYTGNELYQILLPGHEAAEVMEEWLERNIQADIRFRRARTKGCIVSRITQWHPGCKVNIINK